MQLKLSNQINCSNLSCDDINNEVKKNIDAGCKHLLLKNVSGKSGL